ncbi:hypothetical protein METHB2_1300002 [Candidatus Methylobacter favarea]|uniref:Uncharacterized protein n=1 Tax=Candidatus Methylobacter favarea TaxID=2707345 RepID=A0A8S0XEK1_9GAMM|nr:hypothetical protein METHB2_1300002 [Candidatus Methylobacter favarea]
MIIATSFIIYPPNPRPSGFYSSWISYSLRRAIEPCGDSDHQFQSQEACKWSVSRLRLAMDHDCDERLGKELLATLDHNQPLPSLKALQERYLGR